jgi:mono/diheme cytochrome c family protein
VRAARVLVLVAGFGGAALLDGRAAHALVPAANASGDALYQRECAPCHGPAGHGDGAEAPSFERTPTDLVELASRPLTRRTLERIRKSRLLMLGIAGNVVAERRKRMAEEIVGYLQRLPDVDWPRVRRGADVYAERCESCHGPFGRPVAFSVLQRGPRPTGPQPRPDFQKAHGDDELIARALGNGHPALPGFAPVADEVDARALLAYLRVLSAGFARYSLWCAGCHGDDGRGDGVFASGVDDPDLVLDRRWIDAQDPAELRQRVMHVMNGDDAAVPHYQRELSEGQARAILSALRGGAPPGAFVPVAPAAPAPRGDATPAATPRPPGS